jgi:hypothetical protein
MQLLEELSTSPLGLYAPLLGVRIFGLGLCQLLVAYRDPCSSVHAKLSKLLVRSNQEEGREGGEGTRETREREDTLADCIGLVCLFHQLALGGAELLLR